MKIGIDARNFYDSNSTFIDELIKTIEKKDTQNYYNIYADSLTEINSDKIKIINSKKYKTFFSEQTNFFKKLLQDKNDVVIFFDDTRPIFYKKDSVEIISSLEKILYPNLAYSRFFKKHTFLSVIKSNLKNSKYIVCFDDKTKKDINEKLNIHEKKIKIIKGFFSKSIEPTSKIDIKTKHNIIGDYIIYDSLVGVNKNIKRLLESLKEINKEEKINIIFLGNEIADDFETRQIITSFGIGNLCTFAGNPPENELGLYYKNSLGVIYPSIYESFPKSLSNAVYFDTPIIAGETLSTKSVFGDTISYFLPLSTNDMIEKVKDFIKSGRKANYENIRKNHNSEVFLEEILKLIEVK